MRNNNDDSIAKGDIGTVDVIEKTIGRTIGIMNSHVLMNKSSSLFCDFKGKNIDLKSCLRDRNISNHSNRLSDDNISNSRSSNCFKIE